MNEKASTWREGEVEFKRFLVGWGGGGGGGRVRRLPLPGGGFGLFPVGGGGGGGGGDEEWCIVRKEKGFRSGDVKQGG